MKQKYFWLTAFLAVANFVGAQTPKWVEKAKQAVFSVITYDADDKILHTGNGFFVSEQGEALADYHLFSGAQRAVIVNSAGVQMPVDVILGVNEMYDAAHFRVGITGKKVPALALASAPLQVDAEVYLLPYSTRKDRSYTAGKVEAVDKVEGGYSYYTLRLHLADKMLSCPLMNGAGEVVALAQKSSGQDSASVCYGLDAAFVRAQCISALSYNDPSLRGIGIKKSLPDTEEQALVFLFMGSTQLPADKYADLLNDFVEQYPKSADGYLRRAALQLSQSLEEESLRRVEEDMNRALQVTKKADDAHFNRAKLIYSYMLARKDKVYGDWSLDKALDEIRKASAINPLPLYKQLEGDILFAKADYAGAYSLYDEVNRSNLASAETFFSAAKTKELLGEPAAALALADSCVARFAAPYGQDAAPYLLERAALRMKADSARQAMTDYDAYFKAMNGQVGDLFYYIRSKCALKVRQNQRALDDMAKAVELNPKELSYRAELAALNIRWKRNEEAIEVLKEAVEVDAGYAEAYRLMGVAYIQLGQKDEACACFARAKELGDENVDTLIAKYCK